MAIPSIPENFTGVGLQQSAGSLAALQIASRVPPSTLAKVGKAVNAARSIAGLITGGDGSADVKLPLLGGLSLNEARAMYKQAQSVAYARRNFFFIQIAESYPSTNSPSPLNLLAVECSYNGIQLQGDVRRVGAASIDVLEASERTELRITTFDDEYGTLKRWYREVASRAANKRDGTFNVPSKYSLDFYIYHAVNEGYDSYGATGSMPYYEVLSVRPVSGLEFDLSRREASLQELPLTFVEVDTCMGAGNGQF